MSSTPTPTFTTSLLSGGLAGLSVDLLLYPIDTIKTRLQSPQGFKAAGGLNGVYKGIGSVALGSAPGAGVFFCVYDTSKRYLSTTSQPDSPFVHMASACLGEVTACMVRVPTEVVKSKMQTGASGSGSVLETFRTVLNEGGVTGGIYRGFGITVMREIPFALIQFPIYER